MNADSYRALLAADQPWIISSKQEIKACEDAKAEFAKSWLAKHPFPGQDASYQVKLDWVGSLRDEYETELEESYYRTDAPEPHEVAAQALMAHAPDTISVGLRMPRAALETLVLDTEDQSLFEQGLANYGLPGYKGESRSWEAYKKWLLEISQPLLEGGTANDKDTTVLIGSIDCNKSDSLVEKCVEVAKNLGLRSIVRGVVPVDFLTLGKTCYKLGIMLNKVGEFLYRPIDGVMSYQMELKLAVPSDREKNKEPNKFLEQLDALQEKTKSDGDPKEYMLVPKSGPIEDDPDEDDSDEDQPGPEPTAENHIALWVPAEYFKVRERIQDHFTWGKGECRAVQQRLQKGNTDSGNLKIYLFQAQLTYLKNMVNSFNLKFCVALALTQAASDDNYWIIDNESPEKVAKLIGELAKYWRTILLKKDDATIGLGLGAIDPEGNQEMSESRQALYRVLEMCGKEFKECGVKFNWKPVNTKRRKKNTEA